jgi:hypothetical protein
MTAELQTERLHIVRAPGERGGEKVITATRTGAVFIARLLQAGEVSRALMVRPPGARQRSAWSRPTVHPGGAEKAWGDRTEGQRMSAAKDSSGFGVTGYSPGDLPWRRPRRRMAVRGGRLELAIITTPNEVLSMEVNMAQNGWSLGECLELLGFLPPSHPPRVDRDGE